MQQVIKVDRRHTLARALPCNLAQIQEELVFLLRGARQNDGSQKTPLSADSTLEDLPDARLKNIRLHILVRSGSGAPSRAQHDREQARRLYQFPRNGIGG